ncbi:hypothetical protein GmHk_07G019537 [Glycine max]|nr:hypothetical protein GmHk_07G019537 [Glycine max]
MASPPGSPPPSPSSDESASPSAMKWTRKATLVHVDPATGKADGPHRKKLRAYLGVVACDKELEGGPYCSEGLDLGGYSEFEIPEASDSMTKKKLSMKDRDSLNQTSQGNEPLQPNRTMWTTLSDVRKKAQAIQKQNTAPHVLSRGGYEYLEQKLLAEKTKKKLEEAAQSGSVDDIIDPPSPVRRHVKWKMVRTKKTGEMTIEAAKEIADKIDSFEEQASHGSFVPHGRQDVLTAAIGCPEHPGRVCAAGAGVTIRQYFRSAPWTSRSSSLLPPEELQQLTQQIRDQLEESITKKVTRQLMALFS